MKDYRLSNPIFSQESYIERESYIKTIFVAENETSSKHSFRNGN